jgi:hypothetical protein
MPSALLAGRWSRRVPVVKKGRLTGIGNVVKSRVRELELERDQLDSYVHSGQS